jgi:hypothetical protein
VAAPLAARGSRRLRRARAGAGAGANRPPRV